MNRACDPPGSRLSRRSWSALQIWNDPLLELLEALYGFQVFHDLFLGIDVVGRHPSCHTQTTIFLQGVILSLTAFSSVANDLFHFVLSVSVSGHHVVISSLRVRGNNHVKESLPRGKQPFALCQLDFDIRKG